MNTHKFNYNWKLKDAIFTKDKGTVFSCFSCGGGSTMGYKLAGFDVIGCNEIDPKMMEVYKLNHNPKYSYLESITTFKDRKDLPEELYNLDILDGSPPCSSFSMAGNREKDWGKDKKFREGQAEQVLDTLFFDFIELAKELQPKVVIAENVKGLLLGNAFEYVRRIYDEFDKAGYYCQHWLLDASKMGVPQRRERVFFICLRKDLAKPFLYQKDLFDVKPFLEMEFNEQTIRFKEICDYSDNECSLGPLDGELWEKRISGDVDLSDISIRERSVLSRFNAKFLYKNSVANTIPSSDQCVLYDIKRNRNKKELLKCGSYPFDYNFNSLQPQYLIGMSVPPVMTAQIASNVYDQWLSVINSSVESIS
jgi:DNA (cytosine-5)-methyltransferase 1